MTFLIYFGLTAVFILAYILFGLVSYKVATVAGFMKKEDINFVQCLELGPFLLVFYVFYLAFRPIKRSKHLLNRNAKNKRKMSEDKYKSSNQEVVDFLSKKSPDDDCVIRVNHWFGNKISLTENVFLLIDDDGNLSANSYTY